MEYVVYTMTCNSQDVDHLYIGSTINFVKRVREHKNLSKHNTNKLYTAIRSYGGFSNWTMEIIESCTCDTVLEARIRERFFCEELRADLNSYRPHTRHEEKNFEKVEGTKRWRDANKEKFTENERRYYKNNQEKIKQYQSQYKIANKDKIKQYQLHYKSRKVHCDACNCECGKADISTHNKTKKHLNNLELKFSESKNDL